MESSVVRREGRARELGGCFATARQLDGLPVAMVRHQSARGRREIRRFFS